MLQKVLWPLEQQWAQIWLHFQNSVCCAGALLCLCPLCPWFVMIILTKLQCLSSASAATWRTHSKGLCRTPLASSNLGTEAEDGVLALLNCSVTEDIQSQLGCILTKCFIRCGNVRFFDLVFPCLKR